MSYISFGNKELFEFVNPEKYLLSLLTWEKKHTVRFETPRWKCNKCGSKFLQYFKENQEVALCKKCWKEGILTFPEPTTRLEVGDVIDLYWRSRVPKEKKVDIMPYSRSLKDSWHYKIEHRYTAEFHHNYPDWKRAHNLSDTIGKAVITDVWYLTFQYSQREQIWYFGEGQLMKNSIMHRIKMCDLRDGLDSETQMSGGTWVRTGFMNKFAKEDGFDSLEKFEGYFSKNLKEGETKIGTVYEYRSVGK